MTDFNYLADKVNAEHGVLVLSTEVHPNRVVCRFANGWGVSLINDPRRSGLIELAVLGSDGKCSYATDVTTDVIPGLMYSEALTEVANVVSLDREGHLPCRSTVPESYDSGGVWRQA